MGTKPDCTRGLTARQPRASPLNAEGIWTPEGQIERA